MPTERCIQSRTEGFALLQFKSIYTTNPETARAQTAFRNVTRHNQSAMPFEDLGQHGSDSGSSDYSPDSDVMPNYCTHSSDSDAFSLDPEDDRISPQKHDGHSDSPAQNPSLYNSLSFICARIEIECSLFLYSICTST